MGKISIRPEKQQRSDSAQSEHGPNEVPSAGVETENPEAGTAAQHQSTGGFLASPSPPTLHTSLSAVGGSLVSAPAFCHNSIGGDVNFYFVKEDATVIQRPEPVSFRNKSSAEEALMNNGTTSKTILRTPKKVKRKPQIIFHRNKTKSLNLARRLNVSCSRLAFDGITHQPAMPALEEGTQVKTECIHPPGGQVLTGEITGSRVTVDYCCYKCRAAVPHFKAKAFRVKCPECGNSWRCDKVQCTCTAEITIELLDGSKRTVVLTDSLLHSIVPFNTQGYCNTDKLEKNVLKVGSIRMVFMGGLPIKVQTTGLN